MWGIIIYDENYFISKNEYFTLNSFEFENGGVLNDVNVEYMSFGTPIYDDNGIIKNAIVYCHGSLGSYSSIKKLAPLLGENDAFDENKYFELELKVTNELFVVEVEYFDKGFDPEKIPVPNLAEPREGGLGVFIIKQIMDFVKYKVNPEDGAVLLTMVKQLASSDRALEA